MSLSQIKNINVTLLVRSLNASDSKAYSHLFDLFWEDMYRHAFTLVQNEPVAKDIIQEIWIDIWNRRKLLGDKNFEAYLHKAVRNNCYKYFRSRKLSTVHLEAIESLAINPSKTEQKHNLTATQQKVECVIHKLLNVVKKYLISRQQDIPTKKLHLTWVFQNELLKINYQELLKLLGRRCMHNHGQKIWV